MTNLNAGRICLCIGLSIGLISLWTTFIHIGDPDYVLITSSPAVSTHPWHHNFREVLGDLAAMAIFITVFFGKERFRTKETWLITFILMVGYYAGFWIGTPFLEELASDTWRSEIVHISMSFFSLLGLFLARSTFHNNPTTSQE